MSKLQKFYGAQSVNQKCVSSDGAIETPQYLDQVPGVASPNGRHADFMPEILGQKVDSVLSSMKEEAELHLHEIKGKIKVVINHKNLTSQEIVHLKNNLAELRQKMQATAGQAPGDFDPILTRLEHHLSVLSRMYLEE